MNKTSKTAVAAASMFCAAPVSLRAARRLHQVQTGEEIVRQPRALALRRALSLFGKE